MADLSVITERLKRYFAEVGRRRWQPGVLDCAILVADWAVLRGRPDPIADLRGRYHSERQFMRIIRREGDLLACSATRLARSGLVQIDGVPQSGDVLLVSAPYALRHEKIQRRPTCALAVDASVRAVVTSDRGLMLARDLFLPTLAVWRFEGDDA